MKTRKVLMSMLGGFAASALFSTVAHAESRSCSDLSGLEVASGVVETADGVAASEQVTITDTNKKTTVPTAFCRVLVRLKPTNESDIRAEFWLPERGAWNGKFVGLGNGGFGGSLDNSGMLTSMIQKGYAGAATDMGHRDSPISAKWADRHHEKVIDWARRANHLTALVGKQLVRAYYGNAARRSYFMGCSDGGREALMEAWRFPNDYEGVIAGAPAADFTSITAQFVWNSQIAASAELTMPKLLLISHAVLAECDELDGVKDGVLENPRQCRFNPAILECRAGDGPNCLTAAQVKAVNAIRRGPQTRDGAKISNGFFLDDNVAALGWNAWITSPTAVQRMMGTDFYRWMVYDDPDWTSDKFDLDRDWPTARMRLGGLIDADHPNLRAFARKGGKLLLYHGWSDPALPPENTIHLYETVRRQLGAAGAQDARLFMVPGMSHCGLGAGPSVFDTLSAMDKWVETGKAPERIVATMAPLDITAAASAPKADASTVQAAPTKPRSRPLCVWPKVAVWDGKGSTDDAANFMCRIQKNPAPA